MHVSDRRVVRFYRLIGEGGVRYAVYYGVDRQGVCHIIFSLVTNC